MSQRPQNPMVCTLCGASANKFSRDALGWDWFTGYMDETVHFCPACRRVNTAFVSALHMRAVIAPAPPLRRHARDALLCATAADIAAHGRKTKLN